MRGISRVNRSRVMKLLLTTAAVQFGSCNIGQIPVTTTIDGTDLIITLVRGAILTPIDNAITTAIRDYFEGEADE